MSALQKVAGIGILLYVLCVSAGSTNGARVRREDDKDSNEKKEEPGKLHLNQDDRKDLLNAHNMFRANVDPPATDMVFMTWSKGLEILGQAWANKCSFNHGQPEDEDRPEDMVGIKSIGQNLWAGTGMKLNFTSMAKSWNNEVQWYNYDSRKCDDGKACGHYTQVVWNTSIEVGCGFRYCKDGLWGKSKKIFNSNPASILVCNYYKAGNYPRKPYTKAGSKSTDQMCTKCPEGFEACENNLCIREDKCSNLTACVGNVTRDEESCLCNCEDIEMGPWCDEMDYGSAIQLTVSAFALIVCVIASKVINAF